MHALILLIGLVLVPSANDVQTGESLYRQGRYEEARRVLSELADPANPQGDRPRLLYLLASTELALEDPDAAETTYLRLVETHPEDAWSLKAFDFLSTRAIERGDWDRGETFTRQFLEHYLSLQYSTVDDHVSEKRFERLKTCEEGRSPGVTNGEIQAKMRDRYPVTTTVGRVVSYFTRPDPADPSVNLVTNPGFELDSTIIGTPAAWSYRGTEPNLEDDADGTLRDGDRNGIVDVHSGSYCVGKFTSWGTHRGWFFQTVPVQSGHRYRVTVYGMTPITKDSPGQLRLGVDAAGGTDPEATSVVWSTAVSSTDEYERFGFEGDKAIRAESDAITVFLELQQPVVTSDNAMLFDDVEVRLQP